MAGLRLKTYGFHNAENLKRSFLFSAESPTMLVTLNMILMAGYAKYDINGEHLVCRSKGQ